MRPTEMAKPGRNDRCPCGSGKKYKQCCLTNDEAAERQEMAVAQAGREQRDAERRERARQLRANFIARLRGEDPLDAASNAVVALLHAGKLDEAEAAARDLLARFPDEHDGWARLGMVHETRGQNREAADCYRRMLDVISRRPDDYDLEMITDFTALIARLDPPATPAA
jgi:tetratricopeptide (TPR) repeat protein